MGNRTLSQYIYPDTSNIKNGYNHSKGKVMKIAEKLRRTNVIRAIESYHDIIKETAEKRNLNPNMIRAIIYEEQTHNKSPGPFEILPIIDSVGPMAINRSHWNGNSKIAMFNTKRNIRMGGDLLVESIERIKEKNPQGLNIAQIASNYNLSTAETVITDYGKRVEYFYAWFEKNYKE